MERHKIRKRTKNKVSTSQTGTPPDSTSSTEGAVMDVDKKPEEGGDLEDETVYRKKELEELEGLISPDVKADIGASSTGLYELIGTCESSCDFATICSVISLALTTNGQRSSRIKDPRRMPVTTSDSLKRVSFIQRLVERLDQTKRRSMTTMTTGTNLTTRKFLFSRWRSWLRWMEEVRICP